MVITLHREFFHYCQIQVTMIHSKILLDSVSPAGHRLTTFELTYPRFIHSQLMTHRVFSRNAQSSRAERTEKLINRMLSQPVRPLEWRYAQRGMQPGDPMTARHARACDLLWDQSMRAVLSHVKDLVNFNASKEVINRLLEPYLTITTILTGTDFGNFFKLRCDLDTQKEMRVLANQMRELYENSDPRPCDYGSYHNPFTANLPADLGELDGIKVGVARAARVSYGRHDGTNTVEQNLALYDRLLESGHLSPFEHVARPSVFNNPHTLFNSVSDFEDKLLERNLTGWVTHRAEVEK